MAPDQYLPTACYSCKRLWLASPQPGGMATCHFCSGPARVVPGESYRAQDREQFEKIENAVHASQLTDPMSQQLWATLSNVQDRRQRPERVLRNVVATLPSLELPHEVVAEDRAKLSNALGMISVVVSARLRAAIRAS